MLLFPQGNTGVSFKHTLRFLDHAELAPLLKQTFVVEVGGKLAGEISFCFCEDKDEDEGVNNRKRCPLESVFVEPMQYIMICVALPRACPLPRVK